MKENRKTVFVSGSNRGIGKAVIKKFAENGWNVIAHARTQTLEQDSFLASMQDTYHIDIIPIFFDLRDTEGMKTRIKEHISKPKIQVNALVNNAGVCDIRLFMMAPVIDIKELFEINFFSQLQLTQLILKRMPQGGSIVNVSSADAIFPQKGESAYAASKAALAAWTKVLAQEMSGRIRVNAVAPCAVDTDLAHSIAGKAAWDADSLISPETVAKAIYYLSSDDSAGIQGEILKIQGG